MKGAKRERPLSSAAYGGKRPKVTGFELTDLQVVDACNEQSLLINQSSSSEPSVLGIPINTSHTPVIKTTEPYPIITELTGSGFLTQEQSNMAKTSVRQAQEMNKKYIFFKGEPAAGKTRLCLCAHIEYVAKHAENKNFKPILLITPDDQVDRVVEEVNKITEAINSTSYMQGKKVDTITFRNQKISSDLIQEKHKIIIASHHSLKMKITLGGNLKANFPVFQSKNIDTPSADIIPSFAYFFQLLLKGKNPKIYKNNKKNGQSHIPRLYLKKQIRNNRRNTVYLFLKIINQLINEQSEFYGLATHLLSNLESLKLIVFSLLHVKTISKQEIQIKIMACLNAFKKSIMNHDLFDFLDQAWKKKLTFLFSILEHILLKTAFTLIQDKPEFSSIMIAQSNLTDEDILKYLSYQSTEAILNNQRITFLFKSNDSHKTTENFKKYFSDFSRDNSQFFDFKAGKENFCEVLDEKVTFVRTAKESILRMVVEKLSDVFQVRAEECFVPFSFNTKFFDAGSSFRSKYYLNMNSERFSSPLHQLHWPTSLLAVKRLEIYRELETNTSEGIARYCGGIIDEIIYDGYIKTDQIDYVVDKIKEEIEVNYKLQEAKINKILSNIKLLLRELPTYKSRFYLRSIGPKSIGYMVWEFLINCRFNFAGLNHLKDVLIANGGFNDLLNKINTNQFEAIFKNHYNKKDWLKNFNESISEIRHNIILYIQQLNFPVANTNDFERLILSLINHVICCVKKLTQKFSDQYKQDNYQLKINFQENIKKLQDSYSVKRIESPLITTKQSKTIKRQPNKTQQDAINELAYFLSNECICFDRKEFNLSQQNLNFIFKYFCISHKGSAGNAKEGFIEDLTKIANDFIAEYTQKMHLHPNYNFFYYPNRDLFYYDKSNNIHLLQNNNQFPALVSYLRDIIDSTHGSGIFLIFSPVSMVQHLMRSLISQGNSNIANYNQAVNLYLLMGKKEKLSIQLYQHIASFLNFFTYEDLSRNKQSPINEILRSAPPRSVFFMGETVPNNIDYRKDVTIITFQFPKNQLQRLLGRRKMVLNNSAAVDSSGLQKPPICIDRIIQLDSGWQYPYLLGTSKYNVLKNRLLLQRLSHENNIDKVAAYHQFCLLWWSYYSPNIQKVNEIIKHRPPKSLPFLKDFIEDEDVSSEEFKGVTAEKFEEQRSILAGNYEKSGVYRLGLLFNDEITSNNVSNSDKHLGLFSSSASQASISLPDEFINSDMSMMLQNNATLFIKKP